MTAGATTQNRDFIRVGRSRIEGTGVFAKRRIPRGARILEYTGEQVPIEPVEEGGEVGPGGVYRLVLNDTTAIDGARNGNDARYVNHSCDPNCEMYVFDRHAYLYSMRGIVAREELTFDYRLAPANPAADAYQDEAHYPCRCGAASCRGTLVAPRQPNGIAWR